MFRAATVATSIVAKRANPANLFDPGITPQQNVTARRERVQNVYTSDLRWWAAAAVAQLATAIVIFPMFWGWWTLGRKVTLSPFGIALAFDAPILADVHSAAGVRGVVDKHGGMKLSYGILDNSEGVGQPEVATTSGRVGIGDAQHVSRPRKGQAILR